MIVIVAADKEGLKAQRNKVSEEIAQLKKQAHTRAVELEPDLPQLVVGKPWLEVPGDSVAHLLEAQAAHEAQVERGCLVDALEDGELAERDERRKWSEGESVIWTPCEPFNCSRPMFSR